MHNKKPLVLSKSAIETFLACPDRYYLAYTCRIRPDTDAEQLRRGTLWHGMLETVYESLAVGDTLNEGAEKAWHYAVQYYQDNLQWDTSTEHERHALYAMLTAYLEHYQPQSNADILPIANEYRFNLEVGHTQSGRPILLQGSLDQVFIETVGGRDVLSVVERKTTGRTIDDESSYWDGKELDLQVRLYAYALSRLMGDYTTRKHLEELSGGRLTIYSIPSEVRTVYDVTRVPSTKPKRLTQKATQALLTTGEYCGAVFQVEDPGAEIPEIFVDGEKIEATIHKSGEKSIVETMSMYACRIHEEALNEPDKNMARRVYVTTQHSIAAFGSYIQRIADTIDDMERNHRWYGNNKSCYSPGPCPYTGLCHNGSHQPVSERIGRDSQPTGFVNLTQNRKEL